MVTRPARCTLDPGDRQSIGHATRGWSRSSSTPMGVVGRTLCGSREEASVAVAVHTLPAPIADPEGRLKGTTVALPQSELSTTVTFLLSGKASEWEK